MLDEPQILQTEPRLTAFIHLTIPREQIREVMWPGLCEVREVIAAQGVAATGPWFAHHLKMDPDVFDFRISVPVAQPIVASGRVQPGELAARRVARTNYRGPYEELGDGWGEFMGWIETHGHNPAVDLWECYVTGPESGDDASKWCTELNRPLVG